MEIDHSKIDSTLAEPETNSPMEKIIDIDTAHLKSKEDISHIIEQNDLIIVQIPLHSINSTNSYVDIIIDYIKASYIAETISEYSERQDIQINHDLFHYPVVHLKVKPTQRVKLAEVVHDLSNGFTGEDAKLKSDFVSNEYQHENEIDNKLLVYPELVDNYYANLINGAYYELAHETYEGDPDDEPEKIESKYFEKIYARFPERRFGYWKSAFSRNINQDFYCSTEGWIIPNPSDFTTIVKEYYGTDNLQFTKVDFFVIGNISYLISDGFIVHFPFDSFLKAKRCSSVLSKIEYFSHNVEDIWMNRFLTFNRAVSQLSSSKENYRGYPEDRTEELIIPDSKGDNFLLPPPVVCFYLSEYGDPILVKDLEYSYLFFGTDKLTHNELISLENRLSGLFHTIAKIAGIHGEIKCPWEKLNDEKFEELCYDIIYHNPKIR